MLQAALFDLDGTLLDRLSCLRVYLYGQVERLSNDLHALPFGEYMERVIELDAHGHADKEELFRIIERDFTLSPGTWHRLLDDFLTYFPHICVPFPKAHQMLTTLRQQGIKMGLVTNGAVDSQQPKIDGLGIARYFDIMLLSEAEGVAKPDAEIFRRATDNLGVSPEQTVMIGDNPEADIRGAKSYGMKAIWKRDAYWEAPEIVDAIVDNLDELPSTIRNLV
jgi:putative hydrolase of the HAD superfamily